MRERTEYYDCEATLFLHVCFTYNSSVYVDKRNSPDLPEETFL